MILDSYEQYIEEAFKTFDEDKKERLQEAKKDMKDMSIMDMAKEISKQAASAFQRTFEKSASESGAESLELLNQPNTDYVYTVNWHGGDDYFGNKPSGIKKFNNFKSAYVEFKATAAFSAPYVTLSVTLTNRETKETQTVDLYKSEHYEISACVDGLKSSGLFEKFRVENSDSSAVGKLKNALNSRSGEVKTFAILSAENPGIGDVEEDLPTNNEERTQLLYKSLDEEGFDYIKVDGYYNEAEHSVIVYNILCIEAQEISRKFGQESFFWADSVGIGLYFWEGSKYNCKEISNLVFDGTAFTDYYSEFEGFRFHIYTYTFDGDLQTFLEEHGLKLDVEEESLEEAKKKKKKKKNSGYLYWFNKGFTNPKINKDCFNHATHTGKCPTCGDVSTSGEASGEGAGATDAGGASAGVAGGAMGESLYNRIAMRESRLREEIVHVNDEDEVTAALDKLDNDETDDVYFITDPYYYDEEGNGIEDLTGRKATRCLGCFNYIAWPVNAIEIDDEERDKYEQGLETKMICNKEIACPVCRKTEGFTIEGVLTKDEEDKIKNTSTELSEPENEETASEGTSDEEKKLEPAEEPLELDNAEEYDENSLSDAINTTLPSEQRFKLSNLIRGSSKTVIADGLINDTEKVSFIFEAMESTSKEITFRVTKRTGELTENLTKNLRAHLDKDGVLIFTYTK